MKKLSIFIASLLTLTTLHSHATNLAIDIGKDVFSVEVGSNNFAENNELSVATTHTDDLHLYSLKGLVTGALEQNNNVEAALGGKAYLINFYDENIQALALGGEITFKIPRNEKFALNGAFYYAPSPILSDDLEYLADLSIRASYQLLDNGAIYINYRKVQAGHEWDNDLKMDSGFNIGLSFLF